MDQATFRTQVLARHLQNHNYPKVDLLHVSPCVNYTPEELYEPVFKLEQQRGEEMTMKRINYLREQGVFDGWLTRRGPNVDLSGFTRANTCGVFDHSLGIKIGVQFFLWGGAIKFMGTKRHHDKWLKATETYEVKGCFAMTELGHGSNVRGIETMTRYDASTQEFIISTPCESAQKYWIGGAANDATHAVVFSQLEIDGVNQGVHAFIAQIRDKNGNKCPNVRIADCGHRNWRFAAFLAPLTCGRVTIATCSMNTAKIGLGVAIRYSLSRRAFSIKPNEPEVLLLDYPSHQRRLLPLIAKTLLLTGVLLECREACGGQGLKTENHVGHLKSEHDVQLTLEGDNNVLMQQVSKTLLMEILAAKKRNKPINCLGLEHLNKPAPIIPSRLTSLTLRTAQFQTDIFCLRERDLLHRFVTEVSQRQAQGERKESIFTMTYQIAEDLGRAFSDRLVLQTFLNVEATVPSGTLKNILHLLRSMYTTIVMEEDASFLRYGYLSTYNAAVVRKEVPILCSELRPHALALVTSFGIPDALLGPIAFNWIDANAWSSV
ncbi:acyl-coenzyme A oxidase 3, peroxisomal-like protein [Tanacetum coccineum]